MFKSFFLKYDFDSFRALVTPASGVSKKKSILMLYFYCSVFKAIFSSAGGDWLFLRRDTSNFKSSTSFIRVATPCLTGFGRCECVNPSTTVIL